MRETWSHVVHRLVEKNRLLAKHQASTLARFERSGSRSPAVRAQDRRRDTRAGRQRREPHPRAPRAGHRGGTSEATGSVSLVTCVPEYETGAKSSSPEKAPRALFSRDLCPLSRFFRQPGGRVHPLAHVDRPGRHRTRTVYGRRPSPARHRSRSRRFHSSISGRWSSGAR